MATLYQIHSTMDMLRRSVDEMSRTWRTGDSILLLGSTVAFISWLDAYLSDNEIQGIANIYALADDVAQLSTNTSAKLNLEAKLSGLLTDEEWVNLTQNTNASNTSANNTDANNAGFDKVVTIAL
ncbi:MULTISPECIES: hypothetical protein [Psychrobacter]|uniref:hypothetical protein n=2 Tax=Moraxellaceae TaxID=468 RepID=UPI001D128E77|nr:MULTISPECIES: hypothetical protein [Psychrobacter]MDN5560395.1 hypothetical protein [Psychrobacter sp.]